MSTRASEYFDINNLDAHFQSVNAIRLMDSECGYSSNNYSEEEVEYDLDVISCDKNTNDQPEPSAFKNECHFDLQIVQ